MRATVKVFVLLLLCCIASASKFGECYNLCNKTTHDDGNWALYQKNLNECQKKCVSMHKFTVDNYNECVIVVSFLLPKSSPNYASLVKDCADRFQTKVRLMSN